MLSLEIKLKSRPSLRLFLAIKNGHADIVQLLLEAEADVEAADCGGIPLIYT
jgi:hypothetical protein